MTSNQAGSVTKYIEPVFRFCMKRLSCRQDAEDLAQEILLQVLDGIGRNRIQYLDAWVWRIAHNRYARLIARNCRIQEVLAEADYSFEGAEEHLAVDDMIAEEECRTVFRALHTLSALYRDILVDYYVHQLSMQEIAIKRSVSLNTVKWRLHEGKMQIKERMDNSMERVYERINWNTTTCNGNMDSNKYLAAQLARAICLAAYEKPLTVSEISLATGIPAIFIEDELKRLVFGDAITQKGAKYQTNFIILRKKDNEALVGNFTPLIRNVADIIEHAIYDNAGSIGQIEFYGSSFDVGRLGYIIAAIVLRMAVREIQNSNDKLNYGPYPPRKDGGHGWFVVSEADDEGLDEYSSGNNQLFDDGDKSRRGLYAYLWLGKYFSNELYRQGLGKLFGKNAVAGNQNGAVPGSLFSEEEIADLIRLGLVEKSDGDFHYTFPIFTKEQFNSFVDMFSLYIGELKEALNNLVLIIWEEFHRFVPGNIHDQINQYISGYINRIIGLTVEELQKRGVLTPVPEYKPLTYNILFINDWPGWQI